MLVLANGQKNTCFIKKFKVAIFDKIYLCILHLKCYHFIKIKNIFSFNQGCKIYFVSPF